MKVLPLAMTALLSLAPLGLTACQSTPKPKPRYTPVVALTDSTILEILPQRASCNSPSPMQCLLVKPQGEQKDSEIFGIGHRDIIGFEPRVGVSYRIKARQEIDQNTGLPTGYWQLEEILSQNIAR